MKNCRFRIFAAVLPALLILFGCGAKQSPTHESSVYTEDGDINQPPAYAADEKSAVRETGETGSTVPEADAVPARARTRKLIRSANFSVEAAFALRYENMNKAAQKIEALARQYGGYIEQSSADTASINCTVRVPSKSYDNLLAGISTLGKIISRRENAEDVTIKYYDLEGRLATKKTLLSTYRSYLARASTIEEILDIESRIADLQNEIDWLGTQLTELVNLVDYASVSLYLFNPAEIRPYSLGDRILRLFSSFGTVASGTVIAIIGIVIFGVPSIFLVLLAYWLLLGRIGLLRKAFRQAGAAPERTRPDTIRNEPNDN
jgi:hypothetical protein